MFDPTTYVGFHTWISLIALATGFVMTAGLIRGRDLPGWTAAFLVTAVATSVTGFGFPFTGILPSHIVGLVALLLLAVSIFARYRHHLAGRWRWIYAVTAVASVYLLAFVGIAQSFQKIAFLQGSGPTPSHTPFAIAEVLVLAAFIGLTVAAVRTFRPVMAKAYA